MRPACDVSDATFICGVNNAEDLVHRLANVSAEIAATVCEEAFDCLKKPIVRLSVPDVHVPFSPWLERGLYPSSDDIVDAVKGLL